MAKKKMTESLVYTGVVSADYMKLDGTLAKVLPGQVVQTPDIFVKQRLAEGIWERKTKPEKDIPAQKEEKERGAE